MDAGFLSSLLALHVFSKSAFTSERGQASQGHGKDAGNFLTKNIRDLREAELKQQLKSASFCKTIIVKKYYWIFIQSKFLGF